MLELILGGTEGYNEATSEYVTEGGKVVLFEHSLISLSKWESKFEKPFLGAGEKTDKELLEYVMFMALTPDFSPGDFSSFKQADFDKIDAYLNSQQTATTFSTPTKEQPKSRELITSELIYYWMIAFKIPFSCETWFLNRLLTLIRVCQAKQEEAQALADRKNGKRRNAPLTTQAKQSRAELNAQRRAKTGSSG
jgi:hypothetical protein